ncbi:universal stress protein [Emticicia sp. BO119]|uniref:universal stress protein n=1 Tax=Emticicia sp. BO119 TaxID=2757768 RepID=UPI0015F0AEF8|nr:universal stress protein [Emticicia sp. BO119]MBA4848893.1 universal stress protein [Emticicia sp. BO119]
MKKVLLTTDFSKASENAIQYSIKLLGDTPCEFTLMHAYDTFPAGGSPEIAYALIDEMFKVAKKEIAEYLIVIKKLDTRQIHTFKVELVSGSPASAIQILNQSHDYDFVVVGATGRGSDILFGSTATDVVRNVDANSLIVPVKAEATPVKNIVLAVDYQPINSFKEFDGLKQLLLQKNATLTLLTVIKDGKSQTELDGLMKFEYHDYFKGINIVDYQIHAENVEEGIVDFLSTHEADMLVMLTRHHSFFDVLFNRSLTRTFAFNATIPLLSIYDEANIEVPEHEVVTF